MIDDVNGVFNHRTLMMQDHLWLRCCTRRREDDERKILRICRYIGLDIAVMRELWMAGS